MAKQTFSRNRISRVATALVISLAVIGCGATNAALSAPAVSAAPVAPIEGSPEQTAIELGQPMLDNAPYRVAPIEGSPEQTALEISRRIATCNGDGDPSDLYRNRDYCMGIGDWTE